MISKSLVCALSFVLIMSCTISNAIAQENCDNAYSQAYQSCMNNSSGATFEMIDCISAEYQYQDTLLNAAYKKLMRNLSTDRQKALKEAQKAWIKFRDSNCDFYYDPDGGSMARITSNDCLMSMTAERAKELNDLSNMDN